MPKKQREKEKKEKDRERNRERVKEPEYVRDREKNFLACIFDIKMFKVL